MTSSNGIYERGDCFIDNINNDCLISIFEHLSLEEKIDIELVCNRWNQVAKLSWNHVNSIDFKDLISYKKPNNKKNNNILLKNVLKRCSTYLNKIIMCYWSLINFEFDEIVEDLSKYCLNVNDLTIREGDFNFFNEEKIKKLFSFFVNLTTLNLDKIFVRGDFFFNLKSDKIKELSLIRCEFFENNYKLDKISNIKNLSKFIICHKSESVINEVVESLVANNCDNFTELFIAKIFNLKSIYKYKLPNIKSLPTLLSRQKKLCRLKLFRVSAVNALSNNNCLQTENLTDLVLYFHSVNPGIITFRNFGNLKKFAGYFDNLTNEFFEAISTCLKLEDLAIYSEGSVNCSGSFDFLHKLKNLETFKIKNDVSVINVQKVNFDDVLQGLWQCKNLKYLILRNCSYTNLSLKNLGSDSNLIIFNAIWDGYGYDYFGLNDISNEEFYEFLKKTPYLREFSVAFCNKITKKLIDDVAELKENRNDKHKLEMNFYECNGLLQDEELTNLSPLINVINHNRKSDFLE